MAGGTSSDENGITGINVTPLVDVMLVLLIIFMVTANLITQKVIGVSLPKASTGNPAETTVVQVEIGKGGELKLENHPVAIGELTQKIVTFKQAGKTLTVSIAADRAAAHGKVIDVIDALRRGGVYDFSFAVAEE